MVAFVAHMHRMALLVVLTLALVATGFAHRAPSLSDEALEVFLASGATAADICGDHGPAGHHADRHCQACQIAGGADLPPQPGLPHRLRPAVVAELAAPSESRHVPRILNPAHGPQAPPVA